MLLASWELAAPYHTNGSLDSRIKTHFGGIEAPSTWGEHSRVNQFASASSRVAELKIGGSADGGMAQRQRSMAGRTRVVSASGARWLYLIDIRAQLSFTRTFAGRTACGGRPEFQPTGRDRSVAVLTNAVDAAGGALKGVLGLAQVVPQERAKGLAHRLAVGHAVGWRDWRLFDLAQREEQRAVLALKTGKRRGE